MDKTEEKILKEPVQNGGSKRASVYPFAPVSEDESGMEDASVRMTSGLTEDEAVSAELSEDAAVMPETVAVTPEAADIAEEAQEMPEEPVEEKEKTPEELKEELMENLDSDSGSGSSRDEEEEEEELLEKPDYETEIAAIIKSNASPKALRDRLSDYHDNDIAEVLLNLTPAYRKKVYRVLDVSTLSGILEYADEDEIAGYLDEMDIRKAAAVLSHMEPDVAVSVLREMDKTKRSLMVDLVDEDFRKDIALLASFDEDEIGSKMTTNYIVIHDDLTVKGAMSELVRQAPENDNISTIFVLDSADVFYGAIDLKDLIIARQGTPLDDLIMTSYPYVYGTENIDDCIEKLKDYSENLIPVLDNSNRMLGVITSQSIIQVVDDELGEDYARLAGLTAEEELAEPLKDSMRKRLPWLIALLLLGMVVSTVVGVFEAVISQLTLIMFFQSMILDMSGNAGTQSLAVTIRVLMDENLTAAQKAGHVLKEVRVGFCNGLLLSSISVLLVGLYIMILKGREPHMAFAISGCVGVALLTAMTLASLLGTTIPMILTKLKVDPAVASGPLITTLNDLIAVVTYYSMSYLLLIRFLGLSG